MKRNDLQTIMRRAWTIARTTGKTFNICLVKAWSLYRLTQRMRAGVVRFAYEKADGTLRRAAGPLHEVAATVKYYDIEAGGWRSFKVENFVTVY